MVKTSCFCRFYNLTIKRHELRRQLDDNWYLEEVKRRHEVQSIQSKKCKCKQLGHLIVFLQYLELQWSDRGDLCIILKLRYIDLRLIWRHQNPIQFFSWTNSQNTEAYLYGRELKQEIDQLRVFWPFLIPQNFKLDDSWSIGKLT